MKIRNLRPEEIEVRVGTINENRVSLLLYKDARCDMAILDECYGVTGWQRNHYSIDGNMFCKVSIYDPDVGWITKEDVGIPSNSEPVKGAASDSFKRACVNIGIGRELYTAPFIWIPSNKVKITNINGKYQCKTHFSVSEITYNEVNCIDELTIVSEHNEVVFRKKNSNKKSYEELYNELDRTGVKIETVLKRYKVKSLDSMTTEQYTKALSALKMTDSKVT